MSINRKKMALGLGLGLGAALLLPSMFGGTPAEAQPRPTGFCSASSEISASGRQNAMVSVSPREPWICLRTKLGGIASPAMPDCWTVARSLGCTQVHDFN